MRIRKIWPTFILNKVKIGYIFIVKKKKKSFSLPKLDMSATPMQKAIDQEIKLQQKRDPQEWNILLKIIKFYLELLIVK